MTTTHAVIIAATQLCITLVCHSLFLLHIIIIKMTKIMTRNYRTIELSGV